MPKLEPRDLAAIKTVRELVDQGVISESTAVAMLKQYTQWRVPHMPTVAVSSEHLAEDALDQERARKQAEAERQRIEAASHRAAELWMPDWVAQRIPELDRSKMSVADIANAVATQLTAEHQTYTEGERENIWAKYDTMAALACEFERLGLPRSQALENFPGDKSRNQDAVTMSRLVDPDHRLGMSEPISWFRAAVKLARRSIVTSNHPKGYGPNEAPQGRDEWVELHQHVSKTIEQYTGQPQEEIFEAIRAYDAKRGKAPSGETSSPLVIPPEEKDYKDYRVPVRVDERGKVFVRDAKGNKVNRADLDKLFGELGMKHADAMVILRIPNTPIEDETTTEQPSLLDEGGEE